MKNAFTLAEVLITLGIIGVVAAMTLPTVMNNIGDKKYEAAKLKAMSVLANGYKMMMAQEGVFEIKDLEMWNCDSNACLANKHAQYFNIVKTSEEAENLPSTYSIPEDSQERAGKTESQFSWSNSYETNSDNYEPLFSFVTSDGIIYGFHLINDSNGERFAIATDVNGTKNPNSVNKDLYLFKISGFDTVTDATSELLENENACSPKKLLFCRNRADCESAGGKWLRQGSVAFHGYSYYCGTKAVPSPQ